MLNKKVWIVCIGIISLFDLAIASQESMKLLDNFSKNLDRHNSFIAKIVCSSRVTIDGEVQPGEKSLNEIRWDGTRGLFLANYELKDVNDTSIELEKSDYRFFEYGDSDKLIEYYDTPPGNPNPPTGYMRTKGSFVSQCYGNFPATPLLGFRGFGDERIDHFLEESNGYNIRDTYEVIEGKECYVIEYRSNGSKCALWICPEMSYSVLKADFYQGPGTKNVKGQIRSENQYNKLLLENFDYKEVDGDYILCSYTTHREFKDGAGILWESTDDVKIIDYFLQPNHDLLNSFLLPIREGTRITNVEVSLDFVWSKGGLQPLVDETIVQHMEKTALSLIGKEKSIQYGSNDVNEAIMEDVNRFSAQIRMTSDSVKEDEESDAEGLWLLSLGLLVVGSIAFIAMLSLGKKNEKRDI